MNYLLKVCIILRYHSDAINIEIIIVPGARKRCAPMVFFVFLGLRYLELRKHFFFLI